MLLTSKEFRLTPCRNDVTGVVIVTGRMPVVVPDEIVTLTVASVPSLLTVGGCQG